MELAISEVKSSVINLNEVKNDIMEVTYFLNDPMFKLLFYCHTIQLKWKILKYFARHKQWVALRKLFSLHPTHPQPYKILCVTGTKAILRRYAEIYTDICFQNVSRIQFFGVKKWCSANVSCDTKQKYVSWKHL